MSYKNLLNNIDELQILAKDWGGEQPSQLELDMALDRVKKIYEILRFCPLVDDQVKIDEPQAVVNISTPDEEQPAPVAEEQVEEEDNFISESISVVEIEIESEPEAEPEPEPEVKESAEEIDDEEEDMILDIDILKSANKERYNKILSLYCDLDSQEPIVAPEPEPAPEPVATPEPTPEPAPAPKPIVNVTATPESVGLYKISTKLGINDRFLLANDLFGGDVVALNEALVKFDELTSLDDTMVHIAENYQWDGDSEGAKLLFTLLQNRFF
ncbi:MAG: hypothetical protein R3Y39_06795 [Rikenellaceae bacterium]